MSASDIKRPRVRSDTLAEEELGCSPKGLDSIERAERIKLLKTQVKNGTYHVDIQDIAMQLANAVNPMA